MWYRIIVAFTMERLLLPLIREGLIKIIESNKLGIDDNTAEALIDIISKSEHNTLDNDIRNNYGI